ncbi:MAG: NAD(P)H-dependent glycerol-3-phosphate dehydrogenase [Eubacteriales bacterium]|nr:NAD(P)H-dependent glycerol-3-phosphate dehydrogenase [Eubacteriales bacterium]
MTEKIAILGAGTWGTALGCVLNKKGYDVLIWLRNREKAAELSETRHHAKLPGLVIPEEIVFTADMGDISDADFVIFAVPSLHIRSTAEKAKDVLRSSQVLISVAKGIEKDTLYTMTEVIRDVLPENPVVALSGPTHAEEVALDLPTAIVAACEDEEASKKVAALFERTCIRAYTNTDIYGVEICAALKNVVALAAGISDGIGFGDNAKAAIITRGIAEIKRLGLAMGCREQTFAGLAGIGDVVVTATSRHSRNNKCGNLIGQGLSVEDAVAEVGMVVEGLNAIEPALMLSEKYGVSMPIVSAMNRIISGTPPKELARQLMNRRLKNETD